MKNLFPTLNHRFLVAVLSLFFLGTFSSLADDQDSSVDELYRVTLQEIKPVKDPTFYVTAFINGEAIKLLVDSGVEVPSLRHETAVKLGIKYSTNIKKAKATDGAARFVLFHAHNTDGEKHKIYSGPVFVRDRKIYDDLSIDGIIPPKLINIEACKIFDFDEATYSVHPIPHCKSLLQSQPAYPLMSQSSDPRLPFSEDFIELSVEGKNIEFLIDTGSNHTYLRKLPEGIKPAPDLYLFVNTVDGRLASELLPPLCFKGGNFAARVEAPLLFDRVVGHDAGGLLGQDFIRQGKLIYVGLEQAYFLPKPKIQTTSCDQPTVKD